MSTVLALPLLFERVVAFLQAESATVHVVFGRREKAKQLNQGPGRANRIVFQPGDDNGGMGELGAAKLPGRNPRPLANLAETAVVYVWAYDPNGPRDEKVQYTAARLLFDQIIRAIHRCALPTEVQERIAYKLSSPGWVIDKELEMAFGAECKFTLTLDAMIPDLEWGEVINATPEFTATTVPQSTT